MEVSGNTVLITGGATGIGLALARLMVASGNQVIICGRRENRLQEAKAQIPEVTTMVCDVADENDRVALFDWVMAEYPTLNVLVNNAGIQRDVDFLNLEEPWEVTKSEIATNLEAPMHLSALFIPHLRQQAASAVINVSSGLGFTPSARVPVYCATKSALHTFSQTLRHQLRETSIEVYEVVPPAVDSELNYESRVKRGFLKTGVTAEEFAAAVLKGLEADEVEIGYGSALRARTLSRAELDEVFQRMNP